MLIFKELKPLYLIIVAVLVLLVGSPLLQKVLVYPNTEFFTEVWILGPEHEAGNYPFNVTSGNNYNFFLDLSNNLGNLSYYQIQVKLRNQNQPEASSLDKTPSSLPSLYDVTAFVDNYASWELPVVFSLNYVFDSDGWQVKLNNMVFNGETMDLSGHTAYVDGSGQCLVSLFLEVWIYDDAQNTFVYHERFVGLWLNLQRPH
jgi:uncharacterized membrane protein